MERATRKRFWYSLTAAALLAAPGAGEAVDPQAVLNDAISALKALRTVRYEATGRVEGVLAAQMSNISGTVTMVAVPGADFPKVRIDAQVTRPKETTSQRVELASDGKTIMLVDHGQRTYAKLDLPAGQSLLSHVIGLFVSDFTSRAPLEREARATTLRYVGRERAGKDECDVIHALFPTENVESRWWFSRKDHLPRRIQRVINSPLGPTTLTISITSLDTVPTFREEDFRLEKPDGFTETSRPPLPGMGPNPGGRSFLPVGSVAPDWTLKTPDGKEVSLRSLRGKVVLLDFWATWCGPCRMAMPDVQKLYEKYKDKAVAVYGVCTWERGDPVAFMQQKGYTYPILLKGDDVAARYRVTGIPTFYLIDPEGKILMAYSGLSPENARQVDELIAETLKKLPG